MADFNFTLKKLREEIERTKDKTIPFKAPFTRVEAVFTSRRKALSGSITGMTDVTIAQDGSTYTVTGTGSATLDELDQGQGNMFVFAKLDPDYGTRPDTKNVIVTAANGATFAYGSNSSMEETEWRM